MNRATTSFPVPDSPCRNTVAWVAATCVAFLSTSRQPADSPMTAPRRGCWFGANDCGKNSTGALFVIGTPH